MVPRHVTGYEKSVESSPYPFFFSAFALFRSFFLAGSSTHAFLGALPFSYGNFYFLLEHVF
jgi:hypothetical protein